MGIAKIFVKQEYTHVYRMWKSIKDYDCTWVRFKAHIQESCLYRKELEQTVGYAVYWNANNIKHGELEDAFTDFVSATAAQDEAFTKLTITKGNLFTNLRQKEGHI